MVKFGVTPGSIEAALQVFVPARWMLRGFLEGIEPPGFEVQHREGLRSENPVINRDFEGRQPACIKLVSSLLKPPSYRVGEGRPRVRDIKERKPKFVK